MTNRIVGIVKSCSLFLCLGNALFLIEIKHKLITLFYVKTTEQLENCNKLSCAHSSAYKQEKQNYYFNFLDFFTDNRYLFFLRRLYFRIVSLYRPIHSNEMKFSATSGDQLEYNGSREQVEQTKQRKLNFEYWNPRQMHLLCTF